MCNHPELFERSDVIASFAFCQFGRSVADFLREGDLLQCPDSWRNPIEVEIPRLFYREGGLVAVPGEHSRAGSDTHWLWNAMNIWSTEWMENSTRKSSMLNHRVFVLVYELMGWYLDGSFSFLPLLRISPQEAHVLYTSPPIRRLLAAVREEKDMTIAAPFIL